MNRFELGLICFRSAPLGASESGGVVVAQVLVGCLRSPLWNELPAAWDWQTTWAEVDQAQYFASKNDDGSPLAIHHPIQVRTRA